MVPETQLYPDTASTPAVPVCATNTAPVNNTTIATQTTASLAWNAVPTATAYDVYLWTGATAPVTPTAANVAATSYNAAALTAATNYSWYVVPKNAAGSATGCSTSNKTSFTTAAAATGGAGTGLQGAYFNNITLTGSPVVTRTDTTVNFDYIYTAAAPGVNLENYSVRWTGQVKAVYSQTYTFYAVTDDGVRLWVNGVQLINNWVNQGATEKSGSIALVAGQRYDIVMEYYQGTGYASSKLYWSSASTPKAIIPKLQLFPPGYVDPTAPLCTTNSLPANGATVALATSASLSWNAAASATAYDLYIWTGATAPVTPTVANIAATNYNATGLTAATNYNWYVVPKNATGSATGCSSSKTTFVTAAASVPSCTANSAPANGSTVAATNIATLTWTAAATATSYDVYVPINGLLPQQVPVPAPGYRVLTSTI
ncbi:PA14 domain protein [Ostertagia ostertagi]